MTHIEAVDRAVKAEALARKLEARIIDLSAERDSLLAAWDEMKAAADAVLSKHFHTVDDDRAWAFTSGTPDAESIEDLERLVLKSAPLSPEAMAVVKSGLALADLVDSLDESPRAMPWTIHEKVVAYRASLAAFLANFLAKAKAKA